MNSEWGVGPIDLERALLSPEVRGDARRLRAILHPEFVEFGLSGRRYDRDAVIVRRINLPFTKQATPDSR